MTTDQQEAFEDNINSLFDRYIHIPIEDPFGSMDFLKDSGLPPEAIALSMEMEAQEDTLGGLKSTVWIWGYKNVVEELEHMLEEQRIQAQTDQRNGLSVDQEEINMISFLEKALWMTKDQLSNAASA